MRIVRSAGIAFGALVMVCPPGAVARPRPSAAAAGTLPTVTLVPTTAQSRPFLAAPAEILAKAGYVEEEYLLAGQARTYDWAVPGRSVKAIAGPGRYVTRILVMRPRDPARFGGNVEVTVLNASLNLDFGGPTDFDRMVRQGDAWIGITTKAVTAKALKTFDPARYAALDWSNPAPAAARCADPTMIPTYMAGGKEALAAMARAGVRSSWPEYEDGLVWDMLGQLGLLLKSPARDAILPGAASPRVYMSGVSQSAIYMRTWVAGFHDRYRTRDGRPVYDGYLAIVGPAMIRINQCARDLPLEDPAQKLVPPDVPFVSISSEGEMWQARHTHQPDAFTRHGGIVSYEVAGSSHQAGDIPGRPRDAIAFAPPADMMKAGVQMPDMAGAAKLMPAGTRPNDFVWQPLVRGAFRNLELWSRDGVRPPQAPGIGIDAAGEVARDPDGNALGGVRMPYIDAPLYAHRGYLSAGGFGGVMGAKRPLDRARLTSLYPDRAAYEARFATATGRLVAGRWISPEDGEAMKAAVRSGPDPLAARP